MLTSIETDRVTFLLMQHAGRGGASPRDQLVVGLPQHLISQFGDGTPQLLAMKAVRLALDDADATTPPAIVQLLRLIEYRDASIELIVERILAQPRAAEDIFAATVLDSGLPFVHRPATRTAVREMLVHNTVRPVLVINGAARMGKSHTTGYVAHILRRQPGIGLCFVDLGPEEGGAVGPAELAQDLVTQLGGDPNSIPQSMTTADRWIKELANWVVYESHRQKWWIVLDGFNTKSLRIETRRFIAALAKAITAGVALQRLRLVLLDFERGLLTLLPGSVGGDTAGPVPRSAVRVCIDEILGALANTVDPDIVLNRVTAGLNDPIDNLPELSARLVDVIEKLHQ